MHLLSSFDIVKGVIREASPACLRAEDLAGLGDYNCFASVSELGAAPAFSLSVRTYEDALRRRVAIEEIELACGSVRPYELVPGSPVPVSF